MTIAHTLRAPTDIQNPIAWGICDRCGFRRYLHDLPFQFDWRGNALVNTGLRVCRDTCLDIPQPNGRRPILIGPDPVPIKDARPGFAVSQMQGAGIVGPVTVTPVNVVED